MTLSTPIATLDRKTIQEVRDTCLCFAAQRAGRALARRFDQLFAPLGITNGQYSMMVALCGMGAPRLRDLADFLAMDHTTLTAAVKPLSARGLVTITPDDKDGRVRRIRATAEGQALIARAVPLWRAEHARIDAEMGAERARILADSLAAVSGAKPA